MRFICDAPGDKTWFGMETEAEAEAESELMRHAVARFYKRAREEAIARYTPVSANSIERDIGLKAHIERSMPLFLTLRDSDGAGLATAMLPSPTARPASFRTIIVGPENTDPYVAHADAIAALGRHFGVELDPEACYPYRR